MKVEKFFSKTKDNRNILPSARIWYMALLWPLTPLVITLIVGGSSAFALDPMGPPIAGPIQGQFRNGVEYSHGTMDFELKEGKVIEFLDGVFFDSG